MIFWGIGFPGLLFDEMQRLHYTEEMYNAGIGYIIVLRVVEFYFSYYVFQSFYIFGQVSGSDSPFLRIEVVSPVS